MRCGASVPSAQRVGVPRRGRAACQSLTALGRHTGDFPNVRSGAGAWPRDTYADQVERLIGAPTDFR